MAISTGLGILIGLVAIALAIVIAAFRFARAIEIPKDVSVGHKWTTTYSKDSPQWNMLPAIVQLINTLNKYLQRTSE